MALTKINFYLGLLAVYAMLITSSIGFMSYQISTDIPYKSTNDEFIDDYIGYARFSNVTTLSEVDTQALKSEGILSEGNDTGESAITDNLASINFYSSRIGKITGYISLVYNAPTFIVYSLGLPYE